MERSAKNGRSPLNSTPPYDHKTLCIHSAEWRQKISTNHPGGLNPGGSDADIFFFNEDPRGKEFGGTLMANTGVGASGAPKREIVEL